MMIIFTPSRLKNMLIWVALLEATLRFASAMPSLLLDSGKAKCVTVAVPKETRLKIDYEAPDWVASHEHDVAAADAAKKTTTLTITSRASHNLMDYASSATGFVNSLKDARDDINKLKNRLAQQSFTEDVIADHGSIPYVMKEDGIVMVCLRAPNASARKPMRFGLSIQKDTLSVMEEERQLIEQKLHEDKKIADAAADRHLTRMEAEMKRLSVSMKNILAEADFAKERDTLLHRQTISMHSASRFWPIVQLCVLIMTSFTQVSHIVRFFKSRRII